MSVDPRVEKVAREYCRLKGINPDHHVTSLKTLASEPKWKMYTERVDTVITIMDALKVLDQGKTEPDEPTVAMNVDLIIEAWKQGKDVYWENSSGKSFRVLSLLCTLRADVVSQYRTYRISLENEKLTVGDSEY